MFCHCSVSATYVYTHACALGIPADVLIVFDELSYTVSESEGVATVRLRKEGMNQRDVAVMVNINPASTQAIGTYKHVYLCSKLHLDCKWTLTNWDQSLFRLMKVSD